jgi:hypothetical protein
VNWGSSKEYRRVQKRVARKIYESGGIVYLCPCKLRPGEPWHPEVSVTLSDGTRYAPIAFDNAVDQFEFYNCKGGAGSYAAYYVKGDCHNQRQ